MTPPPETLTEEERELAILEAERLLELCRTEQHEGNFAKAKEGAEQALVVFSTHHHKSGILSVKGILGDLALAQHRFPEAIELFNECMALAREIGNQRVISATLSDLAAIYTRQKQFDRAHVNLSEALSIAEKHGQELQMGELLHRMGNVYATQGQLSEAKALYSRSLNIARRVGNRSSVAANLTNLGNISRLNGDTTQAIQQIQEAARIAEEISSAGVLGRHWGNLAACHAELQQYEEAIQYFQKALQMARKVGKPHQEGHLLGQLAKVYVLMDSPDRAEPLYREAVRICDTLFPSSAGHFRVELAVLLARRGACSEILTLLDTALQQVSGEPIEIALVQCKRAEALWLLGQTDAARDVYEEVQKSASENSLSSNNTVSRALAELAGTLGVD